MAVPFSDKRMVFIGIRKGFPFSENFNDIF